ncbi:hypothetical protein [Streptomyces sp. IMTB 1903]|uniref:hypothetical protein n=1 Tax=Streptomyces sp. IMTB 1903 TaxID=1776680 RepID=UPI000B07B444|nr:hypothetical protein [Streptomyces sp. IMTB 1903]
MTPDGRTLYVATAGADRVSVIRTDTGTLTHSVPVGGGPTPPWPSPRTADTSTSPT